MEKFAVLLSTLYQTLENEILELYNRFKSYILELFYERKINLNIEIIHKNPKSVKRTIEQILQTIDLAFLTINYPKTKLLAKSNQIREVLLKRVKIYRDYYTYFNTELNEYINKILIEILVLYLFDEDHLIIKNLELYDLLPRNFINQIDKFKQTHLISTNLEPNFIKNLPELFSHINPLDLSINNVPIPSNISISGKDSSEEKKNFQNLTPQKKFIEIQQKDVELKPPNQKLDNHYKIPQNQEKLTHFLDIFRKFSPINSNILEKFKIDVKNLVNTKNTTPEFFDLENLYYFIAILKMLNLEAGFTSENIIDLLRNYVNGGLFISDINAKPDPISNYYGLSILSENNLLNTFNIINASDIQLYLESVLKNFIPDKIHLNFYTILCLKVLEFRVGLTIFKRHLIAPILSLDILSNKNIVNPILDIFEHLAIIKLLDRHKELSQFNFYGKVLKDILEQKDNSHQNITDFSRMLLIFDLLDLKVVEIKTCQKLFEYISSDTTFFNSKNLNKNYNWMIDKHMFTVELRMLFWALIASSVFI